MDALLVVGNPNSLTNGDTGIRAVLENEGYTVTVANDNTVNAGSANGMTVVVISESSDSGQIVDKFRNVSIGVVCCEGFAYDEMGLTITTFLTSSNEDQVTIIAPGHPIANGLAGTVTINPGGGRLTYCAPPAASATAIAHVPGQPTQITVFAFEVGAALEGGGMVLGRRVACPFTVDGQGLTVDGETLFVGCLTWATASPDLQVVGNIPVARAGVDAVLDVLDAEPKIVGNIPVARAGVDGVLDVLDSPQALLVVGNPSNLKGHELAVEGTLQSLGYETTRVNDAAFVSGDLADKDFLFFSETINSGVVDLATNFPKAVLNLEPFGSDELRMIDGTDGSGGQVTTNQIEITDNAHPLAAGLSGTVTIYSSGSTPLGFGLETAIDASAIIVANIQGNSAQKAIFAYEAGAQLFGLVSPARRVQLPMQNGELTQAAFDLLDAAIIWAGAPNFILQLSGNIPVARAGVVATAEVSEPTGPQIFGNIPVARAGVTGTASIKVEASGVIPVARAGANGIISVTTFAVGNIPVARAEVTGSIQIADVEAAGSIPVARSNVIGQAAIVALSAAGDIPAARTEVAGQADISALPAAGDIPVARPGVVGIISPDVQGLVGNIPVARAGVTGSATVAALPAIGSIPATRARIIGSAAVETVTVTGSIPVARTRVLGEAVVKLFLVGDLPVRRPNVMGQAAISVVATGDIPIARAGVDGIAQYQSSVFALIGNIPTARPGVVGSVAVEALPAAGDIPVARAGVDGQATVGGLAINADIPVARPGVVAQAAVTLGVVGNIPVARPQVEGELAVQGQTAELIGDISVARAGVAGIVLIRPLNAAGNIPVARAGVAGQLRIEGVTGDWSQILRVVNVAIYIDPADGVAGTNDTGFRDNPVSNLGDAIAIAERDSIWKLIVLGSLSIDQALPGYTISSELGRHTLTLTGADTSNLRIENSIVTGLANGVIQALHCIARDLQGVSGELWHCCLEGATVFSGPSKLVDCFEGLGSQQPILDLSTGTDTVVAVHRYSGRLGLRGVNAPAKQARINLAGGALDIDASCTDGSVVVSGSGAAIQNAGSSSLDESGYSSAAIPRKQLVLLMADEDVSPQFFRKRHQASKVIVLEKAVTNDGQGTITLIDTGLYEP